jgi:hypothetical protein
MVISPAVAVSTNSTRSISAPKRDRADTFRRRFLNLKGIRSSAAKMVGPMLLPGPFVSAAEAVAFVEKVSVDVWAALDAEVKFRVVGAKLQDASAGSVPQAKVTIPV